MYKYFYCGMLFAFSGYNGSSGQSSCLKETYNILIAKRVNALTGKAEQGKGDGDEQNFGAR